MELGGVESDLVGRKVVQGGYNEGWHRDSNRVSVVPWISVVKDQGGRFASGWQGRWGNRRPGGPLRPPALHNRGAEPAGRPAGEPALTRGWWGAPFARAAAAAVIAAPFATASCLRWRCGRSAPIAPVVWRRTPTF